MPNDSRSLAQVLMSIRRSLEQNGIDTTVLSEGTNHAYMCRCETCWGWWKLCGVGDEKHPPFTQAQLDCDTYENMLKQFYPGTFSVKRPMYE